MAEANNKADHFVGVDLGGTKILSGVFKNSLECIGTSKLSTKSQRGVDAVIERIARSVQDAVDEADLNLKQVAGIGIGAAGAVDFAEGRVIFAPNMEGWKDVPLKKDLEKLLGVPVFVENDCNICALGVHVTELKAKPRDLIGIFVGTGIGGGLIINGELYGGFNHTAGEIGHMVLDLNGPKCGCGNKGCFEALASRTAIFQQIKAGIKDGQKTILTEMLGDDLGDLRSGDLRKAIRRGDKFVARVVETASEYIGIATANLFLNHGIIAYLQGQRYPRETFNADLNKVVTGLPLVVMVNRGTAGPAEIVAAAILENARGDVLGDKTFGVGSVQKVIEIPDGSALILSIAKYYTPAGKAIQDTAITPNILVADNNDDFVLPDDDDNSGAPDQPKKQRNLQNDEQLKRAIEVLKNREAKVASAGK